MNKENMLTYLEAQLEKHLGEYDFAIDWDTKKHTVEVIVVLYAQNQGEEAFEDAAGVQSEEDVIEFEDSLLLYNPARGAVAADDYLTTIPYEGKKGMEKTMIIAIASYLKDILIEGESDLLDFLNDEEEDQEVFELHWEEAKFTEKLAEVTGPAGFAAYPNY